MIQSEAEPETIVRTILVVEDEVIIRLLVCDVLREAGLRVVEAANADEALAYVRSDRRVELVFTDVKMPGSMDGTALARQLREEFPHIKVVMTSGHLTPDDVEGTFLIAKPYLAEQAASILLSILEKEDGQAST